MGWGVTHRASRSIGHHATAQPRPPPSPHSLAVKALVPYRDPPTHLRYSLMLKITHASRLQSGRAPSGFDLGARGWAGSAVQAEGHACARTGSMCCGAAPECTTLRVARTHSLKWSQGVRLAGRLARQV
jgi:hypothetical protein